MSITFCNELLLKINCSARFEGDGQEIPVRNFCTDLGKRCNQSDSRGGSWIQNHLQPVCVLRKTTGNAAGQQALFSLRTRSRRPAVRDRRPRGQLRAQVIVWQARRSDRVRALQAGFR
jgi:hypothetical protein